MSRSVRSGSGTGPQVSAAGFALGLLVFAMFTACGGSNPDSSPQPTATVQRTTDLLRFVQAVRAQTRQALKLRTWSQDGDSRAVFAQSNPHQLELGPFEPGEDCRLRFGLGFNAGDWHNSNGAHFEILFRPASDEPENSAQVIFSESLDPKSVEKPQWQDREVSIPTSDQGPFSLTLETREPPKRPAKFGAWSYPHLVCQEAREARKLSRPDIVLISVDTLRWDHLGLYGYSRETSPTLDALAAESVVFDNAFSTASYTLPAHASMFTGLYPEEHGAGHSYSEAPLEKSATTIAELLRQDGYRTLAFTAGGSVTQRLGMDQGFEEWTERRKANLKSTLPSVFDAIGRASDQPFFLFLHTYDVHAPYEQPEEGRVFSGEGEDSGSAADWASIRGTHYHRHHQLERFRGIGDLIAAYDSGIHYADSQLAVLFDYLKEIGAYDDALIVVTSDHGETLFDRSRYFGHGHTLHDQEVRVPLIVRLPQAQTTGRRNELVQVLDIAPMILAQAGVEPAVAISGHDPFSPKEDPAIARDLVKGEASILGARFVRSRQWKVISPTANYWNQRRKRLFVDSGEHFATGWQIFDLEQDPEETENLFGREEPFPAEVRRLVGNLQRMNPPGQSVETAPPPTGELAESLRALGYLQ